MRHIKFILFIASLLVISFLFLSHSFGIDNSIDNSVNIVFVNEKYIITSNDNKSAAATDYYVDANTGNNASDGLTVETVFHATNNNIRNVKS